MIRQPAMFLIFNSGRSAGNPKTRNLGRPIGIPVNTEVAVNKSPVQFGGNGPGKWVRVWGWGSDAGADSGGRLGDELAPGRASRRPLRGSCRQSHSGLHALRPPGAPLAAASALLPYRPGPAADRL
ncbi:hypothetical protein AAG570_007652 [Ranatra chinensis]|uniref:Uncharacterized protein n=1 Tax=Ranatra chinensis TaxID=642074 RepID=A0ABD0Y7D6_9HEMI